MNNFKIFQTGMESCHWDNKLNFVDANNVVLGYDYDSCCCEEFGWFFSRAEIKVRPENFQQTHNWTVDEYLFDPNYIEVWNEGGYGDDNYARFKLVRPRDGDVVFLYLFNFHNGYYGHGFDFVGADGKIIAEGCL